MMVRVWAGRAAVALCLTTGGVCPADAGPLLLGVPDPSNPSLALWLNAGSLTTTTTSVSTWANQSGEAGRDAVQVTAAAQPTYVASNSLFANRPTVHFDGGDVLQSASAATLQIGGSLARTIFVVFSQDAPGGNRNVVGYGANASNQLFDVLLYGNEFVGHFHGGTHDTITETTQSFGTGRLTIGAISYDGSTVRTYQHDTAFNGSLATKNIGLNTGNSLFQVGGGVYPGGVDPVYNSFKGDIAEVLVFSERLSDSDRVAVDQYLYAKYTTPAVPEPTMPALLALALGTLGFRRRSAR